MSAGGDIELTIDGQPVTQPLHDWVLAHDKPVSVFWKEAGETAEASLQIVQSAGMPALYIDVASGSMDYLHMDKSHEESGQLRLYGPEGQLLCGESLVLRGRGNTSWGAEKKPYNIALSRETDLLGMGAARNWILLSEGYSAINVRNQIVFDYARTVGLSCTPDSRWVELYLNGEYAGLYLLTERNEIHPDRVDIPENGSFLVSMESKSNMEEQKIPYVDMGVSQVFRIRDSAASAQELTAVWKQLEAATLAPDGRDPATGIHWQNMIDLDSWVRKYILEELFGNPDGGATSQYFYRSGWEGKIQAGPVWDYDNAMGGEGYWMCWYPSFLTMNKVCVPENDYYQIWMLRMYQQEAFQHRVRELFEQDFLPGLKILNDGALEDYWTQIRHAVAANGLRWGWSGEAARQEWEDLKALLSDREAFLTDLWVTGTVYHTVHVRISQGQSGYFAVKDGDSLPVIEGTEGMRWFDVQTGEPVDITRPIHADAAISIKKEGSSLPMIHYFPAAAVILALPGLMLLDRYRSKRRENEKCRSVIR